LLYFLLLLSHNLAARRNNYEFLELEYVRCVHVNAIRPGVSDAYKRQVCNKIQQVSPRRRRFSEKTKMYH